MSALLFARTRGSWAAGWEGGGFPYYLSWCQGGIAMIDSLLAGAVIGAILK